MISLESILRITAILLILLRLVYWIGSERIANNERPKFSITPLQGRLQDSIIYFLWFFLSLQLAGMDVFPYPHYPPVQFFGFVLFLTGLLISILGRHELSVYWTHSGEYQIKIRHKLVTTGIYHYIRHPIYIGVTFAFIGGELVAESYLVILFTLCCLFGSYMQARKEEKLMLKQFGKRYEEYERFTSMFVPYIL